MEYAKPGNYKWRGRACDPSDHIVRMAQNGRQSPDQAKWKNSGNRYSGDRGRASSWCWNEPEHGIWKTGSRRCDRPDRNCCTADADPSSLPEPTTPAM